MHITPSKLRENIYQYLDQVIETGIPLEIERKGVLVELAPKQKPSKLARLKKHGTITNGDLESIIEMDWSSEWKPTL